MILKVVAVQYICDYHKQNHRYKTKAGLNTKKSTSFASVLENTIKLKHVDIK